MKRISILLILSALFVLSSKAQEKEYHLFLGGNIRFDNADLSKDYYTISVGKIFINKVIGLNLGYSKNETMQSGWEWSYVLKENNYSVSPFLRFYNEINENLSYYMEVETKIEFYNQKRYGNYTTDKYVGLSIGTNFGLAYAITNRFRFECELASASFTRKWSNEFEWKSTGFNLGCFTNNIAIGLKYYL